MAIAYIVDAVRTPRGRGKIGKGALSHIHPQELLAQTLNYLAERTGNSGLLQFGALEASKDDAAFLVANMAKVSERLRWTARTDIGTGLDAMLRDSCPLPEI